MEEDETNNQPEIAELSQSRPAKVSSVLGKAQAKKRLMAFSISKQAAAAQMAAKKQAQTGTKERRDNDDVDIKGNTTEDGRSISEIGEPGAVGGVFDEKHSKKKNNKKGIKEFGHLRGILLSQIRVCSESKLLVYYRSVARFILVFKFYLNFIVTKMEKARETMEEIEEMKRNELMIRDNSMLYRHNFVNDNAGTMPI